jgi:hypothetical protein
MKEDLKNCFEEAILRAQDNHNFLVAHGVIAQYKPNTDILEFFLHAWNELDTDVYDFVSGVFQRKISYYKKFGICTKTVQRYTYDVALELYNDSQHCGPWHMEVFGTVCPFHTARRNPISITRSLCQFTEKGEQYEHQPTDGCEKVLETEHIHP